MIEEGGVKHYCLVKNLSRLLSSQVSNHNGEHHFCLRCLNPFWSHESLNKHQEYCGNYEAVKIQMPEKGTMLKFKNYNRREKVPFIVSADFECYLRRKLNVGCVMRNSMMRMLRLETIVILLAGIEELRTTRVILSIENLILRLWRFITLVGMIATCL